VLVERNGLGREGRVRANPPRVMAVYSWVLSPGLTVTESKGSYLTIDEWVKARFGAKNIQLMSLEVGQVRTRPLHVNGIWPQTTRIAAACGDRSRGSLEMVLRT
jgi:hypothetical protein